MYSFCRNESYENAMNEASVFETPSSTRVGISKATVADWYQYCRELITEEFLTIQSETGKIGGVNEIIQIDETKIGKRKYHKGRRVEGAWLVGLITDGSEDLRLELCPDNRRTADILHDIIIRNAEVRQTIRSANIDLKFSVRQDPYYIQICGEVISVLIKRAIFIE